MSEPSRLAEYDRQRRHADRQCLTDVERRPSSNRRAREGERDPAGEQPLDPSEGRHLYGADPAAYALGRPDYPGRVYELLAQRCGLQPGSRVLEIGPGTGLVTKHLLAAGAAVTGVEPHPDMGAYLTEALAHPHLTVVTAPFEDADLPDDHYDLLVAATAFHWVTTSGQRRAGRVLRPGGSAAVWWMLFADPAAPDDFDRAVDRVRRETLGPAAQGEGPPFQLDLPARCNDLADAGLVDVEGQVMRTRVRLTAAQVRALYATMAVALRHPPAQRALLLDAIEALVHRDFGGSVTRAFVTAIYLGRRPSQTAVTSRARLHAGGRPPREMP